MLPPSSNSGRSSCSCVDKSLITRPVIGMWLRAERNTVRQSYITEACSLDAILPSRDHAVGLSTCNETLQSATDIDMLMLPCNFVPLRPHLFPSTHHSTATFRHFPFLFDKPVVLDYCRLAWVPVLDFAGSRKELLGIVEAELLTDQTSFL